MSLSRVYTSTKTNKSSLIESRWIHPELFHYNSVLIRSVTADHEEEQNNSDGIKISDDASVLMVWQFLHSDQYQMIF